jgi:hypothetical protein
LDVKRGDEVVRTVDFNKLTNSDPYSPEHKRLETMNKSELDRQQMVEMAEANRVRMEGMSEAEAFAYVESLVDEAEIVFGVWPDPKHPNGFDSVVIKGKNLLVEVMLSGKSVTYRITAVPCADLEQAITAKRYFDPGQAH